MLFFNLRKANKITVFNFKKSIYKNIYIFILYLDLTKLHLFIRILFLILTKSKNCAKPNKNKKIIKDKTFLRL